VTDLASRPLAELFRLEGRVAVVTGGASGIGRAIADRMAEAGAAVLIADLDGAAAARAAQEIADAHSARVHGVETDVRSRESVEAAADTAVSALGGLHIWVNNAGVYPQPDPLAVPDADFDRVLAVNVRGVQLGIEAATSRMRRAATPGVVLNIASTAAFRGAGPYSASKWAVRGLTQGIAQYLGPHGIRVVGLAPTLTDTPGVDTMRAEDDPGFLDRVIAGIPLARMGEPDDIARVAVFAASDAASFLTGTTLVIDGGSLARL